MARIRIKNWSKFQHYKNRRPPWIKFHVETLDDRAIMLLAPFDFRVLTLCWLINSKTGELPDLPDLAFQLRITEKQLNQSLETLTDFIESDASKTLAKCLRVASESSPETETETETENPSCSDSKESKRSNYKYDVWDYNFVERMQKDILDIAPNHNFKGINLKIWANEIRLMRGRDSRDMTEMIKVWKWANNDSFWKTNILSPATFRKQFTKLTLKMNQKPVQPGDGKTPPPHDNDEWKKQFENPEERVPPEQLKGFLADFNKKMDKPILDDIAEKEAT